MTGPSNYSAFSFRISLHSARYSDQDNNLLFDPLGGWRASSFFAGGDCSFREWPARMDIGFGEGMKVNRRG
jgi:hypothetical protein